MHKSHSIAPMQLKIFLQEENYKAFLSRVAETWNPRLNAFLCMNQSSEIVLKTINNGLLKRNHLSCLM